MTEAEIKSCKPFGALVQLIGTDVVIDSFGSFQLVVDAQGEFSGAFTNVRSEVVAVGDCHGYHYLEVGDTAFLSYHEVKESFDHYWGYYRVHVASDTGKLFLFLNAPEKINMVLRGNEIVSPPNRVVLSRLHEENDSYFHFDKDRNEDKEFYVEAVGSLDLDNCTDSYKPSFGIPNKGEKVLIGMGGGIPVESEENMTMDKQYFWCRMSEVMAKID